MARETRVARGRRRAALLTARIISELRNARLDAGLTHAEVADLVEVAASNIWRLEAGRVSDVTVERLSEIASVLGCEISLGLHPVGDPVRDKGQLAVGKRFERLLSDKWRVTDETLLPGAGDLRAWDKLLRLVGASPSYRVGVDIETRVHDVQALTRRTRGRERDGQADAILIVLSDSAHNRRVVDELRSSLGPAYSTSPRQIFSALRSGQRLIGSGVILV
jgi:transcriptional regulator with XRE-family HTH domain